MAEGRMHELNMRQLVVLIIVMWMDFTDGQFPDCITCTDGNASPYHISQPSTNDYVQIISSEAATLTLMCSLNITIPSGMTITWLHDSRVVSTKTTQVDETSKTVFLLRGRPEPSDAGVYQCVFNDTAGYVLRGNITLLILSSRIIQPPVDFHRVTFDESTSSVQLTCSLNVTIPSSVTVTWTHNNNAVRTTLHNKIMQTGSTTTLLINNPQPSDVGDYRCVFGGLNLQRIVVLEFQSQTIISTPTSHSITKSATSSVAILTTTTVATTTTTTTATATATATTATTTATTTTTNTHVATSYTTTSVDLSVAAKTISASINTAFSSTPTPSTSQSDDNNNIYSTVGALVVIVVLLVFIIVTVVMVGIIVVCCKRRKSKLLMKEESVRYSISNGTMLHKPPKSNSETPCSKIEEHDSESPRYVNFPGSIRSAKQLDRVTIQDPHYMNSEVIHFTKQPERMQDNGPHYMNTESIHSTKQAGKDTMKHNHYDVPSVIPFAKQPERMQDNGPHYMNTERTHSTKQAGKDTMKDNHYDVPSVIPFGQVKIQDNPAYTGGITNTEVQYSYADTACY